MKKVVSNGTATKYGGIIPMYEKIVEFKVPEVIRECLGERRKQSWYSNDEIIMGWVLTAWGNKKSLCKIEEIRDLQKVMPELRLPSHDALGNAMKRLATETLTSESIKNASEPSLTYAYYNDNLPMNRMLVQATKKAKAFTGDDLKTLHFDATFIPSKSQGALFKPGPNGKVLNTKSGFSNMVYMIDEYVVNASMRSGDAGSKFQIYESLKNCMDLLDEADVKIGRVISDAAGATKDAMAYIDDRGMKFNMRHTYKKNAKFNKALKACKNWTPVEIETENYFWGCEVGHFAYTMSRKEKTDPHKTYRIVAARIQTEETIQSISSQEDRDWFNTLRDRIKDLTKHGILSHKGKPYKDGNWKLIDGYMYKFFITNDYTTAPEQIVIEYHGRGGAERKFDFMKNDFGWSRMPFMELNQNTVFLIAAALANNLYRALLMSFAEIAPNLRKNMRFPTFFEQFVLVRCQFIKKLNQLHFDYTDVRFEILFNTC